MLLTHSFFPLQVNLHEIISHPCVRDKGFTANLLGTIFMSESCWLILGMFAHR